MRLPMFAGLVAVAAAGSAWAAPSGEQVFTDNCSACHQPTGQGIPGAFPALAGDKFVVGPPAEVIATVLNGRGGMPTFKAELSDEQLGAVLTYVRSAWGNKAPAVAPADVAAVRNKGQAPSAPKDLQAH